MMLDLLKKENMDLVNVSQRCKGKWTRKTGNSQSIIDYLTVKKEDTEKVMDRIDERI